MPLKSSNTSYGLVAVTIHWLSALFIIALLVSGFRAGQTIDPLAKINILRFHAPLGFAILILTITRIIWWWRFDTKPVAAGSPPLKWQELSAKAVHIFFYIIIIGMAGSGIGMFVLSDAAPIALGGIEGTLPDFTIYPPRIPHGLGARAMLVLLALHAGAALYHHFIKQDAILRRMWFDSK